MYRNIVLISFLTLLLNAEFGNSTVVESKSVDLFKSKMGCKVLHQSIVENNDAKINTFGGYKNNLRVGDSFFLKYHFVVKNDKVAYFELERAKVFDDGSNRFMNDPFKGRIGIEFDKSTLIDGGGGKAVASYLTEGQIFSTNKKAFEFRMNSLMANSVFGIDGIELKRYFGNDFIGTYTSTTNLLNQPIVTVVVSFSCQHLTESHWNKISKILSAPKIPSNK